MSLNEYTENVLDTDPIHDHLYYDTAVGEDCTCSSFPCVCDNPKCLKCGRRLQWESVVSLSVCECLT